MGNLRTEKPLALWPADSADGTAASVSGRLVPSALLVKFSKFPDFSLVKDGFSSSKIVVFHFIFVLEEI